MERERPLHSIPDDELLRRLADLLRESRRNEADLVSHIGEVDARRLYAREASPSMFVYCTEVLHLSEAEAYLRITAARASRAHPSLLEMLRDGRLHLSGIARLAPHLTGENASTLLRRATHRSKRQILELVAQVAPRPDVPETMRRLPERHPPATSASLIGGCVAARETSSLPRVHGGAGTTGLTGEEQQTVGPTQGSAEAHGIRAGASASGLRPDRVEPLRSVRAGEMEPLAPGRYKVQFTADARLHDKLERLQALMRNRVPEADLATIIEAAVTETLDRLEARRFALTKAPRKALPKAGTAPASRHIPAAVRRAVHGRGDCRCGYVDEQGRQCPERVRLEFHHRYPFGRGGDHSPGNIGLLCRTHNHLLAEHDYGRGAMAKYQGAMRRPGPPKRVDVNQSP